MVWLPPGAVIGAVGTLGGGAFRWLAARQAARAERERTRQLLVGAIAATLLAGAALFGAIVLG